MEDEAKLRACWIEILRQHVVWSLEGSASQRAGRDDTSNDSLKALLDGGPIALDKGDGQGDGMGVLLMDGVSMEVPGREVGSMGSIASPPASVAAEVLNPARKGRH